MADVEVPLTGSRARDFRLANREAGLNSTPDGYTWHHSQHVRTDADGQQHCLMQLVDERTHAETGHGGGFSKGRVQK